MVTAQAAGGAGARNAPSSHTGLAQAADLQAFPGPQALGREGRPEGVRLMAMAGSRGLMQGRGPLSSGPFSAHTSGMSGPRAEVPLRRKPFGKHN